MKTYLGDSVYCEYWPDRQMFQLYTCNDGVTRENTIWLEEFVLEQLISFRRRVHEALKEQGIQG